MLSTYTMIHGFESYCPEGSGNHDVVHYTNNRFSEIIESAENKNGELIRSDHLSK